MRFTHVPYLPHLLLDDYGMVTLVKITKEQKKPVYRLCNNHEPPEKDSHYQAVSHTLIQLLTSMQKNLKKHLQVDIANT